MPATPVLALPYPSLSDTADVPRDIQALAVKLDGYSSLRPPSVTALPGSPVDGQEIYYLADAATGVRWHLRYNAAAGAGRHWELVGGAMFETEIALEQTSAPGSGYGDLGAVGPDFVTPFLGDWEYVLSAYARASSGNLAAGVGLALGATATPAGPDAAFAFCEAFNETITMPGRLAAVPAGTTIRMRYRLQATPASWGNRKIAIRPICAG